MNTVLDYKPRPAVFSELSHFTVRIIHKLNFHSFFNLNCTLKCTKVSLNATIFLDESFNQTGNEIIEQTCKLRLREGKSNRMKIYFDKKLRFNPAFNLGRM